MLYEILIAPRHAGDLQVTARVEAPSWMAALKAGVERLQLGVDVKHVVADLREDGSVLVTEPLSRRTFRVREADALVARPEARVPEISPPQPAPPPSAARDRELELRLVSAFHRATLALSGAQKPLDAANALLDAALVLIPSEAGAVLLADIAQQEIVIASTRGAAPSCLPNGRIPMGEGVSGHAILHDLGLAVNDVMRDFRYAPRVPESLGLSPRGLLCAPASHAGRSFGALHLVNKRGADARYSDGDARLLGYLSSRLGQFCDRYAMRTA